MTQINGLRGVITSYDATHITVAINSTAFTAYGSAGGPNPPPGPRDNAPANPPKLTRGDIQPDLAGAGEADDA